MRLRLDSATDLPLRRALAQALADDVADLRAEPGFRSWLASLTEARTARLWGTLQPFLATSAVQPQAYTELSELVGQALRVAVLMAAEPNHYKFEYPTAMPATWFNAACMLNRDPAVREDPLTMQRRGRKLRLAVTPIVTVTRFVEEGLVPRKVVYAGVLVEGK